MHIAEIEVVELWQDRALQAVEALESSLTNGELSDSFTADLRLEERPGRQRRLLFSEPSGWWQQVRVCSEADGGLTFEASTRRAGTPTRTVPTQRALVDRLVESLVDSPSPDPSAARTLFELLFPNDLKAQAPDTDNLVLLVDRGSAHYPWELLDDQETQEDREPLGVRRGLVRQLEGSSMRSHVLSATSSRALVVGDTASGLSALPAAQKEARNVAKALRDSGFEAEPLIAESGTKVVQALFSTSYRVVHLAGHGVYEWPLGDGTDATVTGMVLGNGMYLTAGEVGQMRQVPELVVVNCCHLGSMGPAAPASPVGAAGSSSPGASGGSGLSPGTGQRSGNYHRLAASFATELIDIGVRVVVACGWAVDDGAAATFATTFYDRMLSGLTFGEALAAARWQTWNDHPAVNTWGAYQCYGDPDYRLAPDAVVHRATTVRRAPASAEQARVEIENLSQSVDVSRNTRFGLDRLRELYEALAPEDREDDALQVLLARTYNKFGDFDRATQYFEQTLAHGGTALTVRDFEVWIDQVVRAAATSNDSVDDAVATIESAIDRLRTLLDNPAALVLGAHAPERAGVLPGDAQAPAAAVGVDRLWRVASAYKRLALVTCPERPGGSAWRGLDADARGPRPHVGVVRRRTSRVRAHRPASARRPRELARGGARPAVASGGGPSGARPGRGAPPHRRRVRRRTRGGLPRPDLLDGRGLRRPARARRALEPARHGRRGASGPRPLPPRQRARQRGAAASGPRPGRLPPRHGGHRGAPPRRVPAHPARRPRRARRLPRELRRRRGHRESRRERGDGGHGHRLTAYLAYVAPPAKRR